MKITPYAFVRTHFDESQFNISSALTLDFFRHVLGLLSGLFAFAFYVAIFRGTLTKRIQPNATSWAIWSLNDTLLFAASWSAGAFNTLAVLLVYSIFGWAIVIATWKNNHRPLNHIEIFCCLGAVLGWTAYLCSLGSLLALSMAVVVNTVGVIPTLIGFRENPHTERISMWLLTWGGSVLSLASLEHYTLELFLFPVDSFLVSSTVVATIYLLQRQQR